MKQRPWFEAQGPSFTDHRPAVTDRGPRTGVPEGVPKSDLDLVIGGGAAGRRTLRLGSAGLLDWLAEGVGDDNVSTCVNIIPGDYERVHLKKPSSSFVNIMC